jgi:hypothetical protein
MSNEAARHMREKRLVANALGRFKSFYEEMSSEAARRMREKRQAAARVSMKKSLMKRPDA